jgi:uroporphyrinogen-III synthase
MNILITRPLIDSEDLMGKLFSLGHKIIHMPTLKINSINLNPINPEKYGAFIFTSTNAIRNIKLLKFDKNKLCFCVGAITEKIVRQQGYHNTISAGGTVNALKNLIINSDDFDKKKALAYLCGDNISSDLDIELQNEGFIIEKIINYTSEKINELDEDTNKLIRKHPPDIIFVYSKRSAESFIELAKKYSLKGLMTDSRVMCISEKVLNILKKAGWKKLDVFEAGEELTKLNS